MPATAQAIMHIQQQFIIPQQHRFMRPDTTIIMNTTHTLRHTAISHTAIHITIPTGAIFLQDRPTGMLQGWFTTRHIQALQAHTQAITAAAHTQATIQARQQQDIRYMQHTQALFADTQRAAELIRFIILFYFFLFY